MSLRKYAEGTCPFVVHHSHTANVRLCGTPRGRFGTERWSQTRVQASQSNLELGGEPPSQKLQLEIKRNRSSLNL